jgi:hypothetical protein
MGGYKIINIVLVVLFLLVITGQQGGSSPLNQEGNWTYDANFPSVLQVDDEYTNWFLDAVDWLVKKFFMIDMRPYGMSFHEENIKTYRYYSSLSDNTYDYTRAIMGTEIVKGLETIKYGVIESDFTYGDKTKGWYRAYLPDGSEGRTFLKEYIPEDQNYGRHYQIAVPFVNFGRYVPAIPGIKKSFTYSVGLFKEDTTPIDSAICVIESRFLGFEDVTVPAGTFKDCVKLWTRWTSGKAKTVESNISAETILWFAKGVGEVKSEGISVIFAGERDQFPYNTVMKGGIAELISATVDGVDYL